MYVQNLTFKQIFYVYCWLLVYILSCGVLVNCYPRLGYSNVGFSYLNLILSKEYPLSEWQRVVFVYFAFSFAF